MDSVHHKSRTTIHLNGKQYDAVSGQLMAHSAIAKPPTPTVSGQVIDGVTRRPEIARAPVSKQQTHRPPERSKTLMRSIVKKPGAQHKTHHAGNTSPLTLDHSDEANQQPPEHHWHGPRNKQREQRAQTVNRSHLISKFTVDTPPLNKQSVPLTVRSAPPEAPKPAQHQATQAVHHAHAAHPHTQSREELLKNALDEAVSHRQPPQPRERLHHRAARRVGLSQRALKVATSSAAVLLLVGFFAYQNVPNLAMRVAANRAGFAATLPEYRPSGFAQGPIQYVPGEVVVNFNSNSDDRTYRVTQRPTTLNSQALLENVVADNGNNYQTYTQKGKTIYVYDDSDATWVNAGIQYEIEGEAALTGDQLLRIAASL